MVKTSSIMTLVMATSSPPLSSHSAPTSSPLVLAQSSREMTSSMKITPPLSSPVFASSKPVVTSGATSAVLISFARSNQVQKSSKIVKNQGILMNLLVSKKCVYVNCSNDSVAWLLSSVSLWEIATNIPLESHRNRNKIAASLHLRQKLHWRAWQTASKTKCVNGP